MNRRQVVAELRHRVAALEAERDREERLAEIRREERSEMWASLRPLVWGFSVFAAFWAGAVVGSASWWPLGSASWWPLW